MRPGIANLNTQPHAAESGRKYNLLATGLAVGTVALLSACGGHAKKPAPKHIYKPGELIHITQGVTAVEVGHKVYFNLAKLQNFAAHDSLDDIGIKMHGQGGVQEIHLSPGNVSDTNTGDITPDGKVVMGCTAVIGPDCEITVSREDGFYDAMMVLQPGKPKLTEIYIEPGGMLT